MKPPFAFILFVVSFVSARADLLPLSGASDLTIWGKKSNTTLTCGPDRALVMDVRAGEFAYGWAQRPLPAGAVPAQAAGLYGRFRAHPATRAQLSLTLILLDGKTQAYFSCAQGNLSESKGEWVEFFAPLADFKPERAAKTRALKAADLHEGDRVQLSLNSVGGANAVAAFDRLRFLDSAEAETLGRAIKRATLARSLLPEAQCSGAPHPRLLLTPARLQRVRAKAKDGGDGQAAY